MLAFKLNFFFFFCWKKLPSQFLKIEKKEMLAHFQIFFHFLGNQIQKYKSNLPISDTKINPASKTNLDLDIDLNTTNRSKKKKE